MIFESAIREALAQDPLESAKAKVQTRKVGEIYEEALLRTTRALGLDLGAFRASRSIPTEGRQRPAGQRVAS